MVETLLDAVPYSGFQRMLTVGFTAYNRFYIRSLKQFGRLIVPYSPNSPYKLRSFQ